ncbi:STAS domain-containing protein [Mycobacterium sp. 48b]|uniref:STAS domain-containing protein n=1 Tax=Mycobacterium sp. 48b TaxID=3400426 RepID=UPI003AAB96D1
MSVLTATAHAPGGGPVRGIAGARREHGRARFTTHWGRTGGLLRVDGDIDAANADQLVDQVRHTTWCEWLVLDMTTIDFMGTSGITALHTINVHCADTDVRWALVPSRPVSRLLTLCGHNQAFPISESLTAALSRVQQRPHNQ